MNDEQILLDDLNAFEDFMENADVEEIKKEQYPPFELGSYGNSKIVKVTFDSVYVTSKHMAGGVSSIPFDLFSDDYGQYIIAYDNMVRYSGLDISSLPLECVYRLENAYRLRFYKTYLNPVVEVVQCEIVESAEQVHNRICDNFAIVEKTLYEICVDLKSIRDNKHYKTLGYNTFEDYCLENFNITRRTGSKYLSIGSLPNSFGKSTSHFGAEKLYILSRLTDEERSELIQTTDIEHTPVKQLEQKSREIKENRKNDDDSFSDVPVSTSKENQFISMYGKKMNALLKYMKETYNWLFGVNGVSYKSFLGTEKDMPCYDYGTDNIELILKVLPIFCQALKDTANGLIEKDSKADYIKSILVDGVEFDKEVEDNA